METVRTQESAVTPSSSWWRRLLYLFFPAKYPLVGPTIVRTEGHTSAEVEEARREGLTRGIKQERDKCEVVQAFQECVCGAPLIIHKSPNGRHHWSSCPFDTPSQPQHTHTPMTTDPLPRYPRMAATRYMLQKEYRRAQIARKDTQTLPTVDRKELQELLEQAKQQEGKEQS